MKAQGVLQLRPISKLILINNNYSISEKQEISAACGRFLDWPAGNDKKNREVQKGAKMVGAEKERAFDQICVLFSWNYYHTIGQWERERISACITPLLILSMIRISSSWVVFLSLPCAAAMGIRRPSDRRDGVRAGTNFISPVSLDGNLILDLCTPTWVLQLSRDRCFDYKLNFCDLWSGAIFLQPASERVASAVKISVIFHAACTCGFDICSWRWESPLARLRVGHLPSRYVSQVA